MAELVLPEIPTAPMKVEELQPLLHEALFSTAAFLSRLAVPEKPSEVFESDAFGCRSRRVARPNYTQSSFSAAFDDASVLPACKSLTGYLWEHGTPRHTLSRDDDQPPTRQAWEHVVWAHHVQGPLMNLIEATTTRDLVRKRPARAWQVEEDLLKAGVEDLALQLAHGRRRIIAECPTLGLDLPGGEPVQLTAEISLIPGTGVEQAEFLTRHRGEYIHSDSYTWFGRPVVRIERTVDGLEDEPALEAVAQALDRLKWAITVARNLDSAFMEGAAMITSPSGWRGPTLRRGDTLRRSLQCSSAPLDQSTVARVPQLLDALDGLRARSNEVADLIWHFGRSCNDVLSRDAVLDAVIGLEAVLVPGPGESRYRFALHGMALLQDEPAALVHQDLGKLYDLRSKAAHGARADEDQARYVARARTLLAKAIHFLAQLSADGRIDMSMSKGSIGKAVQNYVRATLADVTRPSGAPLS